MGDHADSGQGSVSAGGDGDPWTFGDGGLVNAVADGIYRLDAEGRIVAVNDAIVDVTGYGREELLGSHASMVLDDVGAARVEAAIGALRESDSEAVTMDAPVRTAGGDIVPCELRANPVYSDGEFRGTAGVLRETPDGPGDARDPERVESVADDVLDGAEVAVLVFDEASEVAWINEAAEHYFGLDRGAVLGREGRALFEEHLAPVVEDGESFAGAAPGTSGDDAERFECHVTPGEGRQERWLERRSEPIETGRYAGGRVELYYDVTDRKRTEEALRESERRYSRLVDNVPGMVYRCLDEPGWPMEFVSEGCVDLTGYEPGALTSGTVSFGGDVVHPDDRDHVRDAVETGLDGDGVFTVQYRIRTAGGETRWVWERGRAVEGPSDSATVLEGVITDITDQKRAEEALAESEQRFRSLVEAVEEYAIFMLDPGGHVVTWNEGAERIKGYEREGIVGEHFSTFYTDEEADAGVPGRNLAAAREEGSVEEEGWRVRADGSRFWASVTITAVRDDDGELQGYAKVTRDMTDRREYERQLREERDVVERILETSPIGIGVVEADGEVVRANERMGELVGRPDDVGEYTVADLPMFDEAGDPIPFEERPVGRVLESGEPVYNQEVRTQPPDGPSRWLSVNATPITDEDGDMVRVVATATDVTQFKEQARRLERQRDDLREELDEIYRRIDDAFYALDDEFRFTYLNERAEGLLRADEEELLGENVWEVFPEATDTPAWEAFHEALETQEPTSFELYYDSLEFWAEARVHPSESGLSVYFRDITERKERERELERQRERLAALDNLNAVVQDVTGAVIDQSTREEIEETVCETLATSDSYAFAWVGEVDPATGAIRTRAQVGDDGYLAEIDLSADPEEEVGQGPVGRAVRTREMQVSTDVLADPDFEPWREEAERYGFRSFAAIPVVHEDALYGILGVYSERSEAFSDEERAVVGQLGGIVGHAIAAVERKRALTSDEVLELDFRIPDILGEVDVDRSTDATIALDRSITLADEEFLVYGTADGADMEVVDAIVEALPNWDHVRIVDDEPDRVTFELHLTDPPVLTALAAHGGYLKEARIEDGDFDMTVQVPPSVEVRRLVEVISEAYPAVEMRARRQVTRNDGEARSVRSAFESELTDRQRTVIEAAYFAGYFDWPRKSSGEELAESLDIAPATFSQHLRRAESRIVGALVGGDSAG